MIMHLHRERHKLHHGMWTEFLFFVYSFDLSHVSYTAKHCPHNFWWYCSVCYSLVHIRKVSENIPNYAQNERRGQTEDFAHKRLRIYHIYESMRFWLKGNEREKNLFCKLFFVGLKKTHLWAFCFLYSVFVFLAMSRNGYSLFLYFLFSFIQNPWKGICFESLWLQQTMAEIWFNKQSDSFGGRSCHLLTLSCQFSTWSALWCIGHKHCHRKLGGTLSWVLLC